MLSNPDAPIHPSLPDERDSDSTDTELKREEEREGGRKERKTDGKQRMKRGTSHRKRLKRGGVCVVYLCVTMPWVKCVHVSVS